MGQFFADTFEGADGALLEAYNAGWAKTSSTPGSATILAGRAKHNSSSNYSCYYRSDIAPPSADYTVRGKFYFGAQSGTSASVGICGRMSASGQNLYTARFLASTGLILLKAINGTYSTLATYPFTLVADTEVVVDLKMVGNQISVYLNNALVLGPVTDSSFTAAGYPGLRSINSTTQIQISEMSADDGVTEGATYTIAATAGSFDLSGSSASLRVSRKLAGGNGSFSLTGSAGTLRASRRVAGATGVITLAGSAVTMRAVRRLAAAAGAFTLTGGDSQLVYSPVAEGATIVTSSGQFMLTGSAVAMRVTRRVQAQVGNFALAGSAAAINYSRRMSAAPGAFVVTGSAAILRTARRLAAEPGVFDLAGGPTSLVYGTTIEYARAPAGSGYTPQRNEYQARPAQVGAARPPAIEKANR